MDIDYVNKSYDKFTDFSEGPSALDPATLDLIIDKAGTLKWIMQNLQNYHDFAEFLRSHKDTQIQGLYFSGNGPTQGFSVNGNNFPIEKMAIAVLLDNTVIRDEAKVNSALSELVSLMQKFIDNYKKWNKK